MTWTELKIWLRNRTGQVLNWWLPRRPRAAIKQPARERECNRTTGGPFLRVQLTRASAALVRLAEEQDEVWATERKLRNDIEENRVFRTIEDHYEQFGEANKWRAYADSFGQSNECTFRNRFVLEAIKSLKFTSFVNFGCLYGWLENEVYKLGHETFGVDRNPETRQLNSERFPGPTFVAATDIREFLVEHRFNDGMFVTINTATYFLPSFLQQLYDIVRRQGFKYVVVWEPSPVSRITGRWYRYSAEDQQPWVARGPMLLNNYPALLRKSGFRVIRQSIERPPHPHPDFRSAFFLAERDSSSV